MMSRVMRAKQMEVRLLAMAATRNEGMKPRPFESSRISDQSRFEDAPAPTEDDMISMYFPLGNLHVFRGSLLEASSPVRVPWPRGVPCWQLPSLASCPLGLLEHWDLPRTDLSLGNGFQVVSRLLLDIPSVLSVLVRLPIQVAAQTQEHEDTHRRYLLSGLSLNY